MKRGGSALTTFLVCVLAVPTVPILMGLLPQWNLSQGIEVETYLPYLQVGAVLGAAHVVARPVLRLLFAPLGCLTMGLFGLVIDVALLYFSGTFVKGYAEPDVLTLILTALLINAICAITGSRK